MYTTSVVKTAFSIATGILKKKTDARIMTGQNMRSILTADGAVIGKGNADERKCHRS